MEVVLIHTGLFPLYSLSAYLLYMLFVRVIESLPLTVPEALPYRTKHEPHKHSTTAVGYAK